MGAGTFSEEDGQESNGAAAQIFLDFTPLLSSLPTLDLMFWVAQSLPTQITKCKTRYFSNNFYF